MQHAESRCVCGFKVNSHRPIYYIEKKRPSIFFIVLRPLFFPLYMCDFYVQFFLFIFFLFQSWGHIDSLSKNLDRFSPNNVKVDAGSSSSSSLVEKLSVCLCLSSSRSSSSSSEAHCIKLISIPDETLTRQPSLTSGN